jgi:hypothetical protein
VRAAAAGLAPRGGQAGPGGNLLPLERATRWIPYNLPFANDL